MTGIRISVPDTAPAGEIIDIRVMIQHPMESGFRRDNRGGAIPRDIITRFECTYAGETVFAADFHPAIAANPLLSFHTRAVESGILEFRWEDQDGQVWRETAAITVT